MKTASIQPAPPLTVTHSFNASREQVFTAFSNAAALAEWWGPVECKNTVLQLDFKPGGIFHYKMEKEGTTNYGRFVFGRIEPFDLLEFTNAFADAKANVVAAPFAIKIPQEIFYRILFTEKEGITTVTLTGEPVNASDEEVAAFASINTNVQQGFGATFNKLGLYIEKIKK